MRNIHLADTTEDDSAQPTQMAQPAQEQHSLPRQRQKTNDPLTEYSQRPGKVQRLPDSVAALILCHSGRSKVIRHQIKVVVGKTEYLFANPDSPLLIAKNGTDEKVLWVMNRQSRDCLHLLSDAGEYLETLPLKGQAAWFDNSAASKQALADARASLNRDREHLEGIHAIDIDQAVRNAQHNAEQTQRLVSTFPVAASDANKPGDNPKADQIIAAGREPFSMDRAERLSSVLQSTDRARDNVAADLRNQAKAVEVGALLRQSLPPEETQPEPVNTESSEIW